MHKKETFVYEMSCDGVPYTPETVKYLFGQECSYNPDYPEDVCVRERVYDLFNEALFGVKEFKMMALMKLKDKTPAESDKMYMEYLDRKIDLYEKLRDSFKFVRKEVQPETIETIETIETLKG